MPIARAMSTAGCDSHSRPSRSSEVSGSSRHQSEGDVISKREGSTHQRKISAPPRINLVSASPPLESGRIHLRDIAESYQYRSRSPSPKGAIRKPRSGSAGSIVVPLSVSHITRDIDSFSAASKSRQSSLDSEESLSVTDVAVMRGKAGSQESEGVREEEAKMNGEGREDEGLRENPDRSCDRIPVEQDALRQKLVKSEQRLKACSAEWHHSRIDLETQIRELQVQLREANASRTAGKGGLKRWLRRQPTVTELFNTPNHDEAMEDPLEVMRTFIDSERLYLNSLRVLSFQFERPMRLLATFKPEILSMQQLEHLFLNCSELLILHRLLYDQLSVLSSLPSSTQLDEFFAILEKTFPTLSLYSSFTDLARQQHLQKELRVLAQRQEFVQLLVHCEEKCGGRKLPELLKLPTERLTDYSSLLTHFLDARVRGLPEDTTRRVDALIRFVRNVRFELGEEKTEWDLQQEKIKLLQKMAPDRPIPLELFDSDAKLIKQGPLNLVAGGKEFPRHCFLFSKYISVAQRGSGANFTISEHGMIPLSGAQLHKCVDVEGQPISVDFKSGRQEDRLAFRISFVNNDSLFFRVARPNEWKAWVETLEKTVQDCQDSFQMEPEEIQLYPDVGPKIAAASLEKLFQQLTSPQMFRDNFIEVFLMTHSCFTTGKDVMTALMNCLKSFDDGQSDTSSQGSGNGVFLFNMDEMIDSDPPSSGGVSASTSIYNMGSDVDSESGSPAPSSPAIVHRSHSLTPGTAPSPTPRATPSPRPASADPPLTSSNALDPDIVRKKTHAPNTSDSDPEVSPHTSAVVVDNSEGASSGAKDGWADPEMGLRPLAVVTLRDKADQGDGSFRQSEDSGRGSHGSELEWGDNELSDAGEEATEREAELQSSFTDSESALTLMDENLQSMRKRSISDGCIAGLGHLDEEDTLKALNGIEHSERLHQELDYSSREMQSLIDSLNGELKSSSPGNRRCADDPEEEEDDIMSEEQDAARLAAYQDDGVVRRRSRTTLSATLAERHAIASTISLSEPDLTVIGVNPRSPPPPRAAVSPAPRRGSGWSSGLSSTESSPYRYGSAMTSLPASHKHLSMTRSVPGEERFGASLQLPKSPSATVDRKFARFIKHGRKSETLPGKPPASPILGKSSSMYFSADSPKAKGFKDHFKGLKKKVNKLTKRQSNVNFDETDSPQKSSRSPGPSRHPTPRTSLAFMRSGSITAEMPIGHASPLPPVDEVGRSPVARRRNTSSSQGSALPLVTKIFSVLNVWQENHFEDFDSDRELKFMLMDFLQTLLARTPSDTLEYIRGKQLLKVVQTREDVTPQDHSFPTLLARVTSIDPHILYLHDWDHPEKLMVGKELDLSRSHPKDSPFIKHMAEQLTLMEFAVYAAVQRRELLNCNWKKRDKEKVAPNVCRLIRRTNEMTSWVSTEILSRDTPSSRAAVIENFVQIAWACYHHNDMHCALNITIALSCSAIKSLSKTWDEVDKKYRHKFDKLRDYTDYQGRCKKMRERMERITMETVQKTGEAPTALPYIGAHLDQIYTLEMGAQTYNSDGLVNFAKMTKVSELVRTFLQYQRSCFTFEPRLDIIAYVTAAKRLSDNELYELSTRRESR